MRREGGTTFPLGDVRDALRAGVSLEEALAQAAATHGLPLRALLESAHTYPDLQAPQRATRVCRGTSCELAGAAEVARALAGRGPLRSAHCLGHCAHSPAVLLENGDLLAPWTPQAAPAERAIPIHCLAPEPLVTRRIGRGSFASLERAEQDGAWKALESAWKRPERVLAEMETSGERGRGGAGFETARKWRAARDHPGAKVVVANGDEGDPGSFIDRLLMEHDPHGVLEGLALCALAIGAEDGVVFVRSEYPAAVRALLRAVAEAEAAGWLGESRRGGAPPLRVRVAEGLGRYVCGEETALLATLEGQRGEARPRPPHPSERGLHGRPTVVNNVETLVNVPWIVLRSGAAFAALGSGRSPGTKALCLSRGFVRPGVVEVPFGLSLRSVIEGVGQTPCRRDVLEGVLLGGPMGSFLRPEETGVPIDTDEMAARGIALGHGGLVAVPAGTDLRGLARHLAAFWREEACGRCLPCRAGSRRVDAALAAGARLEAVAPLLAQSREASLCGLGRLAPDPIETLLRLAEGSA